MRALSLVSILTVIMAVFSPAAWAISCDDILGYELVEGDLMAISQMDQADLVRKFILDRKVNLEKLVKLKERVRRDDVELAKALGKLTKFDRIAIQLNLPQTGAPRALRRVQLLRRVNLMQRRILRRVNLTKLRTTRLESLNKDYDQLVQRGVDIEQYIKLYLVRAFDAYGNEMNENYIEQIDESIERHEELLTILKRINPPFREALSVIEDLAAFSYEKRKSYIVMSDDLIARKQQLPELLARVSKILDETFEVMAPLRLKASRSKEFLTHLRSAFIRDLEQWSVTLERGEPAILRLRAYDVQRILQSLQSEAEANLPLLRMRHEEILIRLEDVILQDMGEL